MMFNWRHRSYRKELLDSDAIPFEDIRQNMRELDTINRRLGGHKTTCRGVALLAEGRPTGEPLQIVEIGCGGGDNLRAVRRWAQGRGVPVHLTGIDRNEACIGYAQNEAKNEGLHFIHSDYRQVQLSTSPDIIFSSLFCHHFTDEELVQQLQWMQRNSRIGFFINDLHRHPAAYYAIKMLTQLFSRSYLVKNDAPLSVRRGFRQQDWETLFAKAGIPDFKIRWQWAFRWLVLSSS